MLKSTKLRHLIEMNYYLKRLQIGTLKFNILKHTKELEGKKKTKVNLHVWNIHKIVYPKNNLVI